MKLTTYTTGNRPPWMLPAKAKYLTYDSRRARDNVALPDIRFPKDFMPMSKTTLVNPTPSSFGGKDVLLQG